MKLVFASNSPRRHQLLSMFNLNLIVTSHSFDENSIKKEVSPEEYCKLISKGKVKSICQKKRIH